MEVGEDGGKCLYTNTHTHTCSAVPSLSANDLLAIDIAFVIIIIKLMTADTM